MVIDWKYGLDFDHSRDALGTLKDGPIFWTLCMHLVLIDLAARYLY